MSLITRTAKGSKLTIQEMDGNLEYLETLGETNGYTEYVISIPSSSILDFENTRPEIIPNALTTSSLYVIHPTLSYMEYEFNTTPYILGLDGGNQGAGGQQLFIEIPQLFNIGYYDGNLMNPIASLDSNMLTFENNAIGGLTFNNYAIQLSGSLPLVVQLPTVDLDSPGDGSLRVVVYLKQIIFGS